MRLIIFPIVLMIFSCNISAQQDPEAQKILDRASEKMKSYETIEADFSLNIDNRMEDLHSKSTGSLQVKGNKYYMESMGTEVYFDGKTMWSYMSDINEVTITEPSSDDADFVENPALIFSFYNRDFKYRLIGEAKVDEYWCYEIDLYPNNRNQPYSKFKIFIIKGNDAIYMVQAVSKEAIDYTIFIANSIFNKPIPDSKFTFLPENYPDIEVVDMRF